MYLLSICLYLANKVLLLLLQYYYVQGHKVKHWNCNNSAADCSIAFKFGTEFHHVTAVIRCKCSRSNVKGRGHSAK